MTAQAAPERCLKSEKSPPRTRIVWEICIVLALSVGQSAVYSLLSLLRRALAEVPIGQQQTLLNPARDTAALWDATYRVLDVFFDLAIVALVVYLLWDTGTNALRRMGLDFRHFGTDLGRGVLLLAVIGVPGLALYMIGREMGFTVNVVASPLDAAWWTIPLLVLSAVRASLFEEVVLLGYLFTRLRQLGWSTWSIIISVAALRGIYHSYQGLGAVFGNFVMGLVFGWCYQRWGRVMPLVIAHALLDVIAFVGYPLAVALWPSLFTVPAG